jgi:hypothetical protein
MGLALAKLRVVGIAKPAQVGCEYEPAGLNGAALLLIGARNSASQEEEMLTVLSCEEDERGAGKKLSGRLNNHWSKLELDRDYVMEPC